MDNQALRDELNRLVCQITQLRGTVESLRTENAEKTEENARLHADCEVMFAEIKRTHPDAGDETAVVPRPSLLANAVSFMFDRSTYIRTMHQQSLKTDIQKAYALLAQLDERITASDAAWSSKAEELQTRADRLSRDVIAPLLLSLPKDPAKRREAIKNPAIWTQSAVALKRSIVKLMQDERKWVARRELLEKQREMIENVKRDLEDQYEHVGIDFAVASTLADMSKNLTTTSLQRQTQDMMQTAFQAINTAQHDQTFRGTEAVISSILTPMSLADDVDAKFNEMLLKMLETPPPQASKDDVVVARAVRA